MNDRIELAPRGNRVLIQYIGWSGFLLNSPQGVRVLVDPFLVGSTRGPIPPSPFAIDQLHDVDLVLVTHNGWDHLGQSFDIIRDGGALLGAGQEILMLAKEYGRLFDHQRAEYRAGFLRPDRLLGMVPGTAWKLKDVTVIPVRALHSSSVTLADGRTVIGNPLSYFIRLGEQHCVFHGGDTAIMMDHKLYGDLYRPQTAIVTIGGVPDRNPTWNLGGNLHVHLPPNEAAMMVRFLGATRAIPCHYLEGTGAETEFVAALKKEAPAADPAVMTPGEVLLLD